MRSVQKERKGQFLSIILPLVLLTSLYFTSFYNYLLFHSLSELFSIIIACGVFMIAWNARDLMETPVLVHLGIAYLFIAFLDTMHTLSYTGMGIFTDYSYHANQLWIAARYIEAFSLLGFVLLIATKRRNYGPTFIGYLAVTTLIMISIFPTNIFPVCFIEGSGQTPFKIVSEYVIVAILFVTLFVFRSRRGLFPPGLFRFFYWSIAATIGSEFAFTLYTENYGLLNMLGHYLKIISFYLIYRSLVREGIRHPIKLFYSELEKTARDLDEANKTKNKLFTIIAHDLKNAFNSTIGITNLMLSNTHRGASTDEENRELIGMINVSAKSTYDLLENLLAWSQAESGRLTVRTEPVDIIELCRSVHAYAHTSAKAKEIHLRLDAEGDRLPVMADSNMIYTVLRNLVDNAIKYTRRGGSVSISLRANRSLARIEITDSGIGMSSEEIRGLYSPDKSTSRPGTEDEKGTGLGLQLARDFLKKNGSALEISSAPGNGTRIGFSLPRAPGQVSGQQ
ncbi:MASE3 domain-containing protein [Marispirochaeta aestuarii]|uniref:sensor histidine kinase n=1 Tax=Marispirochaeta aestuarii TaxID=1963862 RepID=UPI002ABD5E54|nr:MASE3 domain-containing protein [Marispirochaeta aestuarii]